MRGRTDPGAWRFAGRREWIPTVPEGPAGVVPDPHVAVEWAGLLVVGSGDQAYPFVAAAAAVGLALVHLYGGRLRFLDVVPRSRLLSLGAGVSVAYVFVHLLPEVARTDEVFGSNPGVFGFLEHHAYVVALLGFVTFYGLERLVVQSQTNTDHGRPATGVFWIHVASFAVYNVVIGYLLFHREEPVGGLLLFAGAMGLHFLVNDYGLRQHHREGYQGTGRWVLVGAVLLGALVGALTRVDPAIVGVPFAFVAGGIVLNAIKEELPERRESRFWAFALGSVLYAAVLLQV